METNQHNIDLSRGNGKRKFKTLCPFCSHSRKKKKDPCLSVDLDKNFFRCWNCGEKGSINKSNSHKMEKKYTMPDYELNGISEKAKKYLNDRGIKDFVIEKMKITDSQVWFPQSQSKQNAINFPFIRDGRVVNVKYRSAKKHFKLVSCAELIFYNIDAIKDTEECIIVEGEFDALSFISIGINHVVSVPNGANNLEYLDNCIDYFENKKCIILATDEDTAGLKLRDELLRRLGAERCYSVDFKDCKDANEYLVKYGDVELLNVINNAKEFPIEGVFTANNYSDNIYDIYQNGYKKGLNINSHFDNLLTWESGRLCTITGIPGMGKSEFTDFITVKLNVLHQWKVAYFSPENSPLSYHYIKLAEKITGKKFNKSSLSMPEYKEVFEYIDNNFNWISPKDENFTLDNILTHARQLVVRKGVKIVVLDPWNRIEHQIPYAMTETNYISQALTKITNFAQQNNVLFMLIAHPVKQRKDDKTEEYTVPTLYDISGSANFFNKTDYGLTIFRSYMHQKTTAYVQKVKFRHMGQLGQIDFKFNELNGRYADYKDGEECNYYNKSYISKYKEEFEFKSDSIEPNPVINDDDMPF